MADYTNAPTRRRTILAATAGLVGLSGHAAADNTTNETNETGNESTDGEATGEESESDDRRSAHENHVRLAHLAPDTGPVDLYAGGEKAFSGIEMLRQSAYETYQPNTTYTLHITPPGAGMDEAIVETEIDMTDGPVTLTLLGEACDVSNRPLALEPCHDNYSELVSDHARLKAVHASPDAPPLDYRTDDGKSIVEGLEFGECGFGVVTSGETVIAVHEAGREEPLARFMIEPDAGSVYSAFAVGYVDTANAPETVGEFGFAIGAVQDPIPGSDSS